MVLSIKEEKILLGGEMNKKIGFIGAGNMGRAIAGGIIKAGIFDSKDILFSDINVENSDKMEQELKTKRMKNNIELVIDSDIIILAVKPYQFEKIIGEIKELVDEKKIIISIAAGIKIEDIEKYFDREIKLVRVMPNTPALVREGMTAIMPNRNILIDELEEVKRIFSSVGKIEIIEESLIDAVIAVSGSSPAYIFMLIEAMGDAAVLEGMDRKRAYFFAAQAVLGAAKMVLETGEHPGKLKDMVCSPGGTTIEAVVKLEEKGFRSSIMEAMRVCANKSKNLV